MAKRSRRKKSSSDAKAAGGELKPEKCPAGVKLLREFEPHGGTITEISFGPDGRQFVTASGNDRSLKIWDAETGQCLRTLTGHSDWVWSCDWSPDPAANRIVSGAHDKSVRIWNPETGECLDTLTGHSSYVYSTAWSGDGRMIVSGSADRTARIWESGRESGTYGEHSDALRSCRFLSDGQHKISCGNDETARIWMGRFNTLATLRCGAIVWSISVNPRDGRIAAACGDGAIRIWELLDDPSSFRPSPLETVVPTSVTVLEGHTNGVRSCAFSPDGRLLASKASDDTVRLWRTDTWQTVGILREPTPTIGWGKLCFHPKQPILATPGERDKTVRLWELDYAVLLGEDPDAVTARRPSAVHYTTGRIALVGDSGVGKTGLGWRLAHGEFREHSSTHGQQFWVIDELCHTRKKDGALCEAVLWDFAGQDDFRLVHSLFLKDVDLGLLLFDPGKRDKPLAGVEFWIKQLRHAAKPLLKTMLVATRCDRGQPVLTIDELRQFCRQRDISGGYIATSAKTNDGVPELLDKVRALIPWDRMDTTVTTATFKHVKDFVLRLKEAREQLTPARSANEADGEPQDTSLALWASVESASQVLLTPAELRTMLEKMDPDWEFTNAQMMKAVGHLANHGYVTICQKSDGQDIILLFPDVLIRLASSLVLAARGNPQGLGALIENQLLDDRYRFPDLAGLDADERETLVDAAVELFLKQNICFRETDIGGSRTFLVFPSLINEKRPKIREVEIVEGTSYHLEGAVETVHAALVVLLGYTDHFSRTNQWQDHAQYEFAEGEVCGFQQITEHEGETELVLYFGEETPQDTRTLFQALFERFLRGRDVKITRYAPVVCPNPKCERQQERVAVMNLIAEGEQQAFCNKCGTRFDLPAAEDITVLPRADDPTVEQEHDAADQRTRFQTALVRVKAIVRDEGKEAPSCFISYAWGVPEHERWVRQLADDIRDSGVHGLLDVKHSTPGTDIDDYIEKILETDFVVVVGTPKLLEKYHAKESDPVVKAEMKLVNTRKMQPNRFGANRVIPVIFDGDEASSLTPQLQNTVFVDFRKKQEYFGKLFDLVLTLHRIDLDHSGIIDLRQQLQRTEQRG